MAQYSNDKKPTIVVLYKDSRSVSYSYDWSANVGSVRKDDALAIKEGDAVAFYAHRPDLKFFDAKYFPKAKKWYVKGDRTRARRPA